MEGAGIPSSHVSTYGRSCLRLCFFIGLSLACSAVGAEEAGALDGRSIDDLVGASIRVELEKAGKLVRTSSDSSLSLLPRHPAAESIRSAVAARKRGLAVEALFLLPRKRPADETARRAELAAVYGLMRSFGSLKGIEYYSASRGRMRELYAESYRIDDPGKMNALADEAAPAPDAVPPSESLFVFQKDTTFGANTYSYAFASFPDAVLVEATNLSKMKYGPLTMVSEGELGMRLLVICADEAIVFYSESSVSAPALFRSRVGESFANRAEALFRWFTAESGIPENFKGTRP